MSKTKIEWADRVWNPVTGCTKISPGCKNCYAERMSRRLGKIKGSGYPPADPFAVTIHPDRLEEPLKWRKPSRVFVCSMGDLFHEKVPRDFIHRVIYIPRVFPQHTFMFLTKRPQRMREVLLSPIRYMLPLHYKEGFPLLNVWLGVSIEDQTTADDRIPWLLHTPAAKRFVSFEPALEPVDMTPYLSELDWVIMGGESGPGARPMHPDWARKVRDDCKETGAPFFFKQWGGWNKKTGGHLVDGVEHLEFPEVMP
ncbi:MAG: phage Gp37/Gp68 family protein [Nitrospinota bacterium]|nr:phage Gp37/Gp68 family protein [Nitrospinota bacterium]